MKGKKFPLMISVKIIFKKNDIVENDWVSGGGKCIYFTG